MVNIELQNKEYSIRDRWEEITLNEFIELSKIEAPEKLIELYRGAAKMNTQDKAERKKAEADYDKLLEGVTVADELRTFPEYYGKVIRHFSTIPKRVIDLMHRDVRERIFNNHLRQFVLSLFYFSPVDIVAGEVRLYDPGEAQSVKIGNEVFLMPETLRIDNEMLPNYRTDIITFSEASAIETAIHELKEDVGRLPRFCAVYLRKKGEKYSDDLVLRREAVMLKLNMRAMWQVFFCIIQLSKKSLIYSLTFSNIQEINEHIEAAESEILESEA